MKLSAIQRLSISLGFLIFSSLSLLDPNATLAQTTQSTRLPPITLDEYLNTTDIAGARLSPDGTAAVIGTESPDWKANTYRHTLWLWTAKGGLRALTQAGSDEGAEWSPDGKWIAVLADRPLPGADGGDVKDSGDSGDAKTREFRAGDSD